MKYKWSSMLNSHSSMEEKKSSMNPFSSLSVIMSLFVLDLTIILQNFYSQIKNILVSLLHLITDTSLKSATSVISNQREEDPDPGMIMLSRGEVQMVMERLGMEWQANDEDEFCGVRSDDIADMFFEQEPSLEEVKEAFEVFDENGDGVIDARELSKLLGAVGFAEFGEGDCRGMMRVFDENGDGVIDLGEFTKLVEKILN